MNWLLINKLQRQRPKLYAVHYLLLSVITLLINAVNGALNCHATTIFLRLKNVVTVFNEIHSTYVDDMFINSFKSC